MAGSTGTGRRGWMRPDPPKNSEHTNRFPQSKSRPELTVGASEVDNWLEEATTERVDPGVYVSGLEGGRNATRRRHPAVSPNRFDLWDSGRRGGLGRECSRRAIVLSERLCPELLPAKLFFANQFIADRFTTDLFAARQLLESETVWQRGGILATFRRECLDFGFGDVFFSPEVRTAS